jgi:hypothetical protein
VGNAGKNSFDPKVFLAKVGVGKAILKFHKNQNVFAQGEVADSIFYIQEGRVSKKRQVDQSSSRSRSSRGVPLKPGYQCSGLPVPDIF